MKKPFERSWTAPQPYLTFTSDSASPLHALLSYVLLLRLRLSTLRKYWRHSSPVSFPCHNVLALHLLLSSKASLLSDVQISFENARRVCASQPPPRQHHVMRRSHII